MDAYLPLFPLKIVAFPGEELNLHIFEPRYKQLVNDCKESGSNFGVGVYLKELTKYGTEVELKEIVYTYEDGRMDIKTKAIRPFHILNFENPQEGRLYPGGEVEYLENDPRVTSVTYQQFLFYLKEMLRLMQYEADLASFQVTSFTFAHVVGLKLEQEFELLLMQKESERQEYLTQHFKKMIPIMKDLEHSKEKIRMNGHFKYLDPLDF
ncbi:LON peptidase substrate-binding domain-containing protein [Litoribacter alkaliphilus]|uniref:LON peptidase substrate-binding domain-containing protein n=1 Tax=Litoribacter ruber TaxID=702568 RepID=A0AAP2CFR8_9BACT|nr:LON peptidase substrate-binding domain-containing protein [Litoribacter alkaliphilus]MBS9523783.1 LON peptidase substrate-binding domain-containing protein [Litoribacter alkaliphilus]